MAEHCDVTYVALCEPEVSVNTYYQELGDDTVAQQSVERTSDNANTVIEIEDDDDTACEEPESLVVAVSPSKILGTPERSNTNTVARESGPNSQPRSVPDEVQCAFFRDNLALTLENIINKMDIEVEHNYNVSDAPETRTVVKPSQVSTVPKKRAKGKKKKKVRSNFNQAQARPQHEHRLRERKMDSKKRSTNFAKKQRAKKKRNVESTSTNRELRGSIASRTPTVNLRRERRSLDLSNNEIKMPSNLRREMEANEPVSAMNFLTVEMNTEVNKSPKLPSVESKTYTLCALIGEALLSSENGELSTTQISEFISSHYPKYNLNNNKRLKSLFSDVLSRKPYFINIGKKFGEKTYQWKLDPSYLAAIREIIVQRGILNGTSSSENEVEPHQYFVDATVIKEDVSIHAPRSAENEKETNESNTINPIEVDDNQGLLDLSDDNHGRMPEVFSYCSSASSSFPIQTAIESISQQECRESPPANDSTAISLSSEDEDIVLEEKVTTFAETTVLELECPLCDLLFSSNESLGSHMSVHSKRRRLTAPSLADLPALIPMVREPSISPVSNSLVVSSTNDDRQVSVPVNEPTGDSSDTNQKDDNMQRALNSLPSSLFAGQRPIIFMGNVYFNHS